MKTFVFIINEKKIIALRTTDHENAYKTLRLNGEVQDGDTLKVHSMDDSEATHAFIRLTLEPK